MIPVKILCGCGQKYAFDVEPVNGRMTSAVACPVCGVDGTAAANDIIAQSLAVSLAAPTPATPPPPPPTRLRPATAQVRVTVPSRPAAQAAPTAAAAAAPKAAGEFNLGLGILGAIIGAGIGAGAMYGFTLWTGFRFPLLGVGIGALTGLGAKLLFKGTDNTLGVISGVAALLSVVGTLYLIYGTFPIFNIISVVVSVSVAYRIASG